jgi:hypothetical protein
VNLKLLGYDSTLWTCTYIFRILGSPSFSVASTPAGDGSFTVASPAATTATRLPGRYTVTALLTDGSGNKYTAGQAEIEIKPDVSILANSDPRSANRKALDDVEAALAAGAGSDVTEYTVAGTVIKKDRAGLLKLRSFYLLRVRAESGKPAIGTILASL